MSKRRDRHGRGVRGPLSWPNPLTGAPIPLRHRPARIESFTKAITASVDRVSKACPRALVGMSIGFEDVPAGLSNWLEHVPLAQATSARPGLRGQVVLYRRPIEFRVDNPRELRALVHRTVLEQLSAATGIPVYELDPDARPEDWDD